ncbi:MAG TPA: twin-arginine translocation signal domain-containing protein [Candidatus Dormibacteraeota bacterium]|nr:twin-arginine translocation signal domain-containing protein [Candidatus Dormibacteraeota bacterium]
MIDRRKFLQSAGVAAAGLATNPPASALDAQEAKSDKEARLFVGCCAMSYSKYLRSSQMTMEDFIRKGVELQLDGVDMTVYFLKSTEPSYLTSLRHLAFKNAISFSGAACGAGMVQTDKTKRAQVLDDIKKWVDVTDQLGASHLRIFGGKLPSGATTE